MDYLEGSLLGPFWSDTDYETRSHHGRAILISLLFWLVLAAAVWRYNTAGVSLWLTVPRFWLQFLILLTVLSPLVSMFYYRLPFFLRLSVIVFQIIKYLCLLLTSWSWIVPHMAFNSQLTFSYLVNWLNNTVGAFVERNTEVNQVFGLVFSAAWVFVVSILLFAAVIAAVIFAPIIYVKLYSALQRLWDWVISRISAWLRHDFSVRQHQRHA
ncbi:hypothetical protein HCH52_06665 [Oscillospiraceae bacterium HV4-5-C5C]|nr:hypothetical protein [Oscillospiraceae bacterium HV4-5-C5C]